MLFCLEGGLFVLLSQAGWHQACVETAGRLALSAPLATTSKLHSAIKVVVLDNTRYWINLGQL